MTNSKLGMSLIWCLGLLGCGADFPEADPKMMAIEHQTVTAIAPITNVTAVPMFKYAAQSLRSPFMPSGLLANLKQLDAQKIQPDLTRAIQPLEHYALAELQMKGSFSVKQNTVVALIQIPDGTVKQVRVGDYIGTHRGRIIHIAPTQIEVLEAIADGQGRYFARVNTLNLSGFEQSEFKTE